VWEVAVSAQYGRAVSRSFCLQRCQHRCSTTVAAAAARLRSPSDGADRPASSSAIVLLFLWVFHGRATWPRIALQGCTPSSGSVDPSLLAPWQAARHRRLDGMRRRVYLPPALAVAYLPSSTATLSSSCTTGAVDPRGRLPARSCRASPVVIRMLLVG